MAKRALKRKTSKKLSNWIDAKRLQEDKASDQSRESSPQISGALFSVVTSVNHTRTRSREITHSPCSSCENGFNKSELSFATWWFYLNGTTSHIHPEDTEVHIALVIRYGEKEPTALHFNSDGTLFIADQSTRSVLHARLIFNGIDIKASPLQSIGCHTQVFGVVRVSSLLLHLVRRMEEYFLTSKMSTTPVGSQVIHVPGMNCSKEFSQTTLADDCG